MVPPLSLLDELLEGHPERPDTAPSINGDGGVSLESVLWHAPRKVVQWKW